MVLSPRVVAWSRRHPLMDGALLGPILGLALLGWRGIGLLPIPYLVILAAAVVGAGVGVLVGARRRRLRDRRSD